MSNDNSGVGYSDDSSSWKCGSTTVMGVVLLTMALSALVTGPLWYLASIKYGKRATWLLSSGLMFCSSFLFLAIGKGDVDAAVALSAVQGAILGNFYLSDAILADIIEYVSTSCPVPPYCFFCLTLLSLAISLFCSDSNPHSNHLSSSSLFSLYPTLPPIPIPITMNTGTRSI